MFFHMLRQSFMRGRRRKALATATLALAGSLITALMNVSIDVGDKMAKEMKSYGANINIVPKSESIPLEIGGVDYNPLKGQVFIDEKELPKIKEIFWHNNIVGFAPFLTTEAVLEMNTLSPAPPIDGVRGTSHVSKSITLIGTHFDKPLTLSGDEEFRIGVKVINPYWQVEGAWPDDEDRGGVLAGSLLAREMNLKIGDSIRIKARGDKRREQTVTIKGILSTGGSEESALVGPLGLVQRLSGNEGKVQSVSVSALTVPEDGLSRKARHSSDSLNSLEYDRWYCTAYVSSISHQIEEAVSNVTARPIWQVAAGEGAVINKIQILMIVVTIAVFIASGLGISSLMATTVMERSREIGLVKALGASDGEVHLLFLAESAIVAVVGGILGCAAGALLSQLIGLMVFGSTVSFNLVVIPVTVVLSVLIALAGSFMPSRLITKLHPAEVLHGRR